MTYIAPQKTIHISPNWQLYYYGFVSNFLIEKVNDPETRDYYRNTPEDLRLMSSPLKIPMEYITVCDYQDRVEDDSSFRIEFNNGFNEVFVSEQGTKHFLSEIIQEGSIILFTESGAKKFAGYVSSIKDSSSSSGDWKMVVSGGGLEDAIRAMTLFLDTFGETSPVSKNPKEIANKKPTGTFQAAFESLSRIVKETKTPQKLIQSIAQEAIKVFLSNGAYGGERYSDLLSTQQGITFESYTEDLIHTITWLNEASPGNKMSFWELMQSLATAPLYELFVHYDESTTLRISEGLVINEKFDDSETEPINDSEPKLPLGHLVFRKTPLEFIDKIEDIESLHSRIPENIIKSMELQEDRNNIFSGVHVRLGVIDNISALLINPVTYNPDTLARVGQRVLDIVLDGVSFPTENSEAKNKPKIQKLQEIQELIMTIFGSGDFKTEGTLYCDYYRGITKGKFVDIMSADDPENTGPTHHVFHRYFGGISKGGESGTRAPRFYVTGVDVTINPGKAQCTMDLHVKWGARGFRRSLVDRVSKNSRE